jgi:predicted alpha/beta-hydrolase family hydrolase
MVTMARALAARSIDVVTFNFLYAEAKRRVPDKNDLLEATWRAVIDEVRRRKHPSEGPLFIGGKSMGGRIATQVAATEQPDLGVAGLVLLGYPLHPPGKPSQLRIVHLPRVRAPMLFVQGSRDVFGTPGELSPIVEKLFPGTRLLVVEGGDHSLALPRSARESIEETLGRVADEVVRFISSR